MLGVMTSAYQLQIDSSNPNLRDDSTDVRCQWWLSISDVSCLSSISKLVIGGQNVNFLTSMMGDEDPGTARQVLRRHSHR